MIKRTSTLFSGAFCKKCIYNGVSSDEREEEAQGQELRRGNLQLMQKTVEDGVSEELKLNQPVVQVGVRRHLAG